MLKLTLTVFQRTNLVFVSNAYHKTRNQWLLHTLRQSSWAPFKRTDLTFSNLVMPSWQRNENTSANDIHLFFPKTTLMGMLLQPHTPGAKTPRTPSKTDPSQERKKKTWVRNRMGTKKICKQFMQSSIAPFLFSLVFFHVGQIPQAPIKKQKCGLMKFINLCYLLPTPSAT